MSEITFAETYKAYADGQQNIGALPDAILATGFIPETAEARGQPLPAQWLNWLMQKLFRHVNRDKVSDAAGVGLFVYPNSVITLSAFDKTNPTRFLHAIGHKLDMLTPHTLVVASSSVLTLGTATAAGNQPVAGGTNVVILATSRQFGDL